MEFDEKELERLARWFFVLETEGQALTDDVHILERLKDYADSKGFLIDFDI